MFEEEYYGDQSRWFVGVVINNIDPEARGRVQVRIHGVHSPNTNEVSNADLPWAPCILPTTEGGTSGIGRIPQLLPGATVFGFFLDGKTSQLPIIIGSIPKLEKPSVIQLQTLSTTPNKQFTPKDLSVTNGQVRDPAIPYTPNQGQFDVATRRSQGIKFFIDNGFTLEQAAGIMGNLEYESGLDTELPFGGRRDPVTGEIIRNPSVTEKSQGIAQWNPAAGRLQLLKRFAVTAFPEPQDWRSYEVQLQFVLFELNSTEARAKTLLKNASSFEGGVTRDNSTWVFGKYYERPANLQASISRREELAATAYNSHAEAS